jgi:hypothetical protein
MRLARAVRTDQQQRVLLDQGSEDHRLDTLHAHDSKPFEDAVSYRIGGAVCCD